MKLTKVTYQKIFPTGIAYLNHKIGVEIDLDDTDSPEKAFQLAKETVDRWNLESNPGMAVAMEYMNQAGNIPEVKVEKINSPQDRMLEAINTCTELKVLESFLLLVKKNPEFQEAYDQKYSELLKTTPSI